MVNRVTATPAALELIATLQAQYGPALFFFQSGGCCDNSAPNCYQQGELTLGACDIHLGDIGGLPFYIAATQYEYWKHTQLIIDVVPGSSGNFSLESTTGKAFIARTRLFADAERAALEQN